MRRSAHAGLAGQRESYLSAYPGVRQVQSARCGLRTPHRKVALRYACIRAVPSRTQKRSKCCSHIADASSSSADNGCMALPAQKMRSCWPPQSGTCGSAPRAGQTRPQRCDQREALLVLEVNQCPNAKLPEPNRPAATKCPLPPRAGPPKPIGVRPNQQDRHLADIRAGVAPSA